MHCGVSFWFHSLVLFTWPLFYDVDIRDYGLDRNPGAMNAFRAKGFWLGASGGLLDALKGFLPVHYFVCDAALVLSPWQMGCVAMSPILGHIFHRSSREREARA